VLTRTPCHIRKETIQGTEYRALIKGLELALERGIKHIRAYMDNQILVDQINDRARLKNDRLKPIAGGFGSDFGAMHGREVIQRNAAEPAPTR
jgi:ribonuclease HI